MKILYHHRIASKDGQYVHIEELTRSLKKRGHELIFVEPGNTRNSRFGQSSRAVAGIRDKLPGAVHELLEFSYGFLDFVKLVTKIIRTKPDCIYERYNLFLPSGIWAKKLFAVPLLLEVNAPLYEERRKHMGITLKRLAQWTEHYVWRSADKVLPVSHVLSFILQENDVSKDRISVIPNGINREEFSISEKSLEIEDKFNLRGKTVLGFVGFLRKWHGLDKVLDTMRNYPENDWHFLVVGDGPARRDLEHKAVELGVTEHLTVTGIVSREDVPSYVSVFDIALQPDVVEYASPLKLFEYMASGKAILAIDRENIREVINNEKDALLFSNDADFSSNLRRLYESVELRNKLGNAAADRIRTEKYFWDENALKVEKFFEELLGT